MHPKNSTTVKVTQPPVTAALDVDEFFSVRPGVPFIDALEISSCRISEILLFLRDHVDEEEGLKVSAVYLMQDHLVGAKAILDSAASGLMCASPKGGVQ